MLLHRFPAGAAVHRRHGANGAKSTLPSVWRKATCCVQPPTPIGNARILDSRKTTLCPSVAAAAAAAAATGPSVHHQIDGQAEDLHANGILTAFKKCRTFFMILAGAAAWFYISSGVPSSGPFASMTLTMPTSTNGAELAAKSAWTGFATGVFHTLCGPDHLAGLAPLSIGRGRLAACALGALWGFGHSTGQMILGLVFALLKDRFHEFMPALDKWSAYIVPLTLIMIGLVGIYESCFAKHEEPEHGGVEATQGQPSLALAGAAGGVVPAAAKSGKRAGLTTYFTGIVHGLQPDALYVVIPALALPTKLAAISFITMFVIGTCAAMGGYTLLIGTTSKALIKEQPWLQSHLSTVACAFSILCGVLMLLAGQGIPVPFFS